ncbi:hypothetical protein [Mucilaginibacter celer]|nr:hypothetical protein [Mucilaginibacter celer]
MTMTVIRNDPVNQYAPDQQHETILKDQHQQVPLINLEAVKA